MPMTKIIFRFFAFIPFLTEIVARADDTLPPKIAQIISLNRKAEASLALAQFADATKAAHKILEIEPESILARNLLVRIQWQERHTVGDFNTAKEQSYRMPQSH